MALPRQGGEIGTADVERLVDEATLDSLLRLGRRAELLLPGRRGWPLADDLDR